MKHNIKKLYKELKRDNVKMEFFKSYIIDLISDSISKFANERDEDFDPSYINNYLEDSLKMNDNELETFLMKD